MKYSTTVGLMLDNRLQRWPNIKPPVGLLFVFAGAIGLDIES